MITQFMGRDTGPKGLWNGANAFTTARLPLALLGMWLYNSQFGGPSWRLTGLLVICFAGFTDLFDGKFARLFNAVSDFGAFYDPVVDKIYTAMLCLFGFAVLDTSQQVMVGLILVSEVAIISYSAYVLFRHHFDIVVSRWGKWGMAAKMLSLGFMLADTAGNNSVYQGMGKVGIYLLGPFGVIASVVTLTIYVQQAHQRVRS